MPVVVDTPIPAPPPPPAAAVVLLGSFTSAAPTLALAVPAKAHRVLVRVSGFNPNAFDVGQLQLNANGDVGANYSWSQPAFSIAGDTSWQLAFDLFASKSFMSDIEFCRVAASGSALGYQWQVSTRTIVGTAPATITETQGWRTVDDDLVSVQIALAAGTATFTADVFAEVGA